MMTRFYALLLLCMALNIPHTTWAQAAGGFSNITVTAGGGRSNNKDGSPTLTDDERVQRALQQSRDNLDKINEPRETLRNKKLIGRILIYSAIGIFSLIAYKWKKKKESGHKTDIG